MEKTQEKREYILRYVPDLKELAESFEQCASRIDEMPDQIFEAMYKIAMNGNRDHEMIADAIEEAMTGRLNKAAKIN